ncbi:MAG TPA: ATP-binding protein [Saprospiraceae bacterium]|nr:ATP-binding protein [Saprospiraceae bacterium]HHH54984.1 ATP-binding protein [Bacteroidota bacterium]
MKVHRLKINSSPDCIKTVKNWIDDIAINYGVCEQLYPDILISITEAVNNAIHHGNRGDQSKNIFLVCKIKERKLKFEVIDEGEGFNPDEIPDPRSVEKIHTENGRGVLIMKSLASKVVFKKKGSKVEITFKYKS